MQKTVKLKYNYIKDGLSEDDVGNKGDRELLIYFKIYVLSYYVPLRSVMSATISAYKRCAVLLYLKLFVRVLISYLRYLCLIAHSDV